MEVSSDCRMVTVRGGVVYPPVGEYIRKRWIREGNIYDCGRSVVREGRNVSPVEEV